MPTEHVIDATGAAGEIRRRLLAVEPGRRRKAILLQHFTEVAAQVLGDQVTTIDPAAPLATLGFNSARTLELRARLESSLQVRLPATLGWQFPTLEALAPYLAERMGIDLEPRAPAAPPPAAPAGSATRSAAAGWSATDPAGAGDDTTALDGLSDGELEALLLARIEQLDEGQQR